MVKGLPTLEFQWHWIKDKQIIFTQIPYTYNYHLIVVDEDETICGFWLIEELTR